MGRVSTLSLIIPTNGLDRKTSEGLKNLTQSRKTGSLSRFSIGDVPVFADIEPREKTSRGSTSARIQIYPTRD
jgi:hypothetical protein